MFRSRPKDHQGEQRAEAGGGQAGQNGDGVDETFVENSQDDVDDEDGHDQQHAEAFDGGLIHLRGALEARGDAGGQMHFFLDALDCVHGGAEGIAGREVEGNGDGGQLADVRNGHGARCFA